MIKVTNFMLYIFYHNKNTKKIKREIPKDMKDFEMEASKLLDIEFKRMVIMMLKELTDNYKELSENYNSMRKEIETINKSQEEIKNTISE